MTTAPRSRARRARLAIVVARARNGVIGAGGRLPWNCRDDMAAFRRVTMGHPVIMGRRTWEGLHVRPLPGRANLVVSASEPGSGARRFADPDHALEAAVALAAGRGKDRVFAIGGARLYRWALPRADWIHLTEIEAEPEGDATFPAPDPACWEPVGEWLRFAADARNEHPFRIGLLRRRGYRE